MSAFRPRQTILPALLAAALALPVAAEEAHHPPAGTERPPATQPSAPPAQPRAQQPNDPGMMTGNMMQMMQMMHQMMSGMMQDRGAMHRMGMMGMGPAGMMGAMPGPMAGSAIEHVEGHIAFLRAELKITPAQAKLWDDFAAAMRANAKQLAGMAADLAKARAGEASPVDRLAQQEKILAARLEIVRRTAPALTALYAAFSDDQKKTFAQLTSPRMGMR